MDSLSKSMPPLPVKERSKDTFLWKFISNLEETRDRAVRQKLRLKEMAQSIELGAFELHMKEGDAPAPREFLNEDRPQTYVQSIANLMVDIQYEQNQITLITEFIEKYI
jgi:hypothetical protein